MVSPYAMPQWEGVQHTPGSLHVSCPSVGVGSGGDGILSEDDGGGGEGGGIFIVDGDGFIDGYAGCADGGGGDGDGSRQSPPSPLARRQMRPDDTCWHVWLQPVLSP